RAVCGVANPRHSNGYGCGLRLASHPDPQRTLTARLIQTILKTLNRCPIFFGALYSSDFFHAERETEVEKY
ncbi:MAG: hypothetical protein FWF12_10675, partial [Betaproteobacteria bacterium]|nr:hypothetical protein [Betaproteobacteria bacterium]